MKQLLVMLLVLLSSQGCVMKYGNYLSEQGSFVEAPLAVGSTIGMPTIILFPLAIPLYEIEYEPKAGAMDFGIFLYFPIAIGDIVATPFLVLKKTFYDLPLYIFKEDEEEIKEHKDKKRKITESVESSNLDH